MPDYLVIILFFVFAFAIGLILAYIFLKIRDKLVFANTVGRGLGFQQVSFIAFVSIFASVYIVYQILLATSH